jgi:hypothetical protein
MNQPPVPLSPYLDLNYRALQDPTSSPLDRLSALTSVQVNLDSAAVTLALHARHAGATWQEIGERLGISKQAAHKRFGVSFGDAE